MDNQATETKKVTETEINNVMVGDFPLSKMPMDYQLTIHINNLLLTYDKNIISGFKEYLYNPEKLDQNYGYFIIKGIIQHYGVEKCRNWFTLIYGWDFTEKAG